MAALPTTLTAEQFRALDLTDKPHLEFWQSEVTRKPMPTFIHGLLQFLLGRLLERYGLLAVPEVRVRLGNQADFVPDVIVTKSLPLGKYPTEPFQLAVEIRSPEQALPWLTKKCRYYISQGVEHAWIIDPEARTAWMFSQDKPQGEWVSIEDNLRVGTNDIPLQSIFDELDAAVSKLKSESGPQQAE